MSKSKSAEAPLVRRNDALGGTQQTTNTDPLHVTPRVRPHFFLYASLCHAELVSASCLYETLKRVQGDRKTTNGLKTEKTDPLRVRDCCLATCFAEYTAIWAGIL